jgi:UDP-glucose 4-epimerase
MSKKILVVGGAGYIGSHMVKYLIEKGESVVVLDNLSNGHRAAVAENIPFYEGNIFERDWVLKLLQAEKITHVMHFAAHAYVGESVTDPLKYYKNNVAAAVMLLDAMAEAGVKFFVFSSTCATYGEPQRLPISEDHPQNPVNPYGETKLTVEKLLRDLAMQKQIAAASLRYFNAAGAASDGTIGEDHKPETHLIPLVLQVASGQRSEVTVFGDDYKTPDGTCLRDYIHVEDLADAHLKALNLLENPGDYFELNLGTGKPASVKEIIEVCRKVTGKEIPVKIAPRRAGDPAELYADNAKAKKILGWEPRYTDIRSIIESAWRWHQKHPNGFE